MNDVIDQGKGPTMNEIIEQAKNKGEATMGNCNCKLTYNSCQYELIPLDQTTKCDFIESGIPLIMKELSVSSLLIDNLLASCFLLLYFSLYSLLIRKSCLLRLLSAFAFETCLLRLL